MSEAFFERPILNSPYEHPRQHWELDDDGQPTNRIIETRRRSDLITPVPKPKKRRQNRAGQSQMVFGDDAGLSSEEQEYNPTPIINEVRTYVATWRNLPNPDQWLVTPETARLLTHWRHHHFEGIRPFFCQIEAIETAIWLTEVAPKLGPRVAKFWAHIEGGNEQANPELVRLALKLATGAGKTTVMADADRLADGQCRPAPEQQAVLARLPHRRARHHHQGPAARASAQRSGELLPAPGDRAS
jgi:type III restriction enzyme